MGLKGFLKTISFASLAGVLLLVVIGLAVPLINYLYMSISCLLMFIILSVIVYFMAQRAVNNPRSGAFLSVVVVNTFFKLIASFAFVFIFVKTQEPEDKFFLIPFLVFYLVFAAAETHFLSTQAKNSKVS